jgi:hypothetical protein
MFDGAAAGDTPNADGAETERDRRLADALDAIRGRYGRDAVRPAAHGPGPRPAPEG